MSIETIRRIGFAQADRQMVEDAVIQSVQGNPERFIEQYKRDSRSFEGRYIAADLFKETFAEFSQSKDARNRYNAPVHNSAAVLSAELFRRALNDNSHPERNTVVFLTGTPGAGKTSSVLSTGELPRSYLAVFEGQLSNPVTTQEKIQQVLDAGFKPVIIAVHVRPELALSNTLKRFDEEGRGASINVMSSIQGGLPASLGEAHKQFGSAVELNVIDHRDKMKPTTLTGWKNLPVLESEGNHDQIKQRLSNALEKLRRAGSISEPAYRQACGLPPLERDTGLDRNDQSKLRSNDNGRVVPPGDSKKAVVIDPQSNPKGDQDIGQRRADAFLNLPKNKALELHPELEPVFAACQATETKLKSSVPDTSIAVSQAVMNGFRDRVADKLRTGEIAKSHALEVPQRSPPNKGKER